MPHYTVILHALLKLIFSFTITFSNNKIILEVIFCVFIYIYMHVCKYVVYNTLFIQTTQ